MSIWATWNAIPAYAYSRGFSNRHPRDTDPKATVGIASIPEHCNPQEPWLRLDTDSPGALTWNIKDADGNPTPAPVRGSVVLGFHSALRLRDQLSAWIDANDPGIPNWSEDE